MSNPSSTEIEAVVVAIVADVDRCLQRGIVLARGVERIKQLIGGDETPSQRYRRETNAALKEMADGKSAAKIARRQFPEDPHRQEMAAQRYRAAWRRSGKK